MNQDRFLNLAVAYGADMNRWPADERAVAAIFAAANPQVVEGCLAAERLLDEALQRYDARDASAALRARIIADAPRERTAGAVRRWIAAAGLGLALAASAAAGVAAGYTLGHPEVTRLLGPSDLDVGEFSALADPAGDATSG
jgi:hypothetical protein